MLNTGPSSRSAHALEQPSTVSRASPEAGSAPVRKTKPNPWRLIRDVLAHGGPGYLQFAITNVCNARCDFCGFAVDKFDPKQRRSVTLSEARDVVDIAVRNHIGYLLFVGGEPLV
ncbi:MAG TPA: radical SAM protein, partial [Verrucomicrobiae bacterium]|nr:radical SAM protein [Verrucomicrobiae bacterium]